MAVTPWADDILGKDIAYNGTVQSPRRKILNFVPGSGISITVADNTGAGSTDVTIISNGSLTGGVDYKDAVRAATTGNITLSALQTIDGVVLAANDRVLVWQQTTASQNGIYVASGGAWQRATDAATSPQVTSGLIVPVSEGTLYTKSTFKLTTINPITLGVTGLVFERQPRTLDDVLSLGNVATNNPILVADAQFIQLGATNPALTGSLRLRGNSNGLIRWRNAANTGETGIELTPSDVLLFGGGTMPTTAVRAETPTLSHTTGGALNWQSYQIFPNQPGILFDPASGNGAGASAFFGANSAATARAGMNVIVFAGAGGTGNQNGGDLTLGGGFASGTGVRGSVKVIDDLATQTQLAQFVNDATPRLGLNVPNLRWDATLGTAPKLWHADQTANDVNGLTLTVQAQNSTGTGTIGAALVLQTGTGTTNPGDLAFYLGAARAGYFNAAGGLFQLDVPNVHFTANVGAPYFTQDNNFFASQTGQDFTVQAQNATGTGTCFGGYVVLTGGTGSSAANAGGVKMNAGATLIAQATSSTFDIATAAWLNIVKGQALGGGAAATLGTIGGSGPTAAAQNKWVEIQSNGTKVWVPAWI